MNEMRKPTINEIGSSLPTGDGGKPTPPFSRRDDIHRDRRRLARADFKAPFRSRLFAMLILFALVPTVAITVVGVTTASRALSMLSARSAWERIALSGEQALSATRTAPLTAGQRNAAAGFGKAEHHAPHHGSTNQVDEWRRRARSRRGPGRQPEYSAADRDVEDAGGEAEDADGTHQPRCG